MHSVYPLIDPAPHFAAQTFKDKVVIITGGSTGIGATSALFYAKAGARVVLVVVNNVSSSAYCRRLLASQ